VPVTFDNSSVVTVQTPDGRWFDVRIVRDDGGWRITRHGPFFGHAGALLAMAALSVLRVVYWLRRSRRKAVEVIPWGPDMKSAVPVHRERAPDDSSARVIAQRLHDKLGRGEFVP
jgi:hypothetical protein